MSPKPPPRPGELPSIITPDQPERAVVRHPGVDGANQPPPARRGTLPGMPALRAPKVPLEGAETLPAPNPLQRQTIRRPTPPSAVAAMRRTPVPPGEEAQKELDAPQAQPGASVGPSSAADQSSLALVRAELAATKVELARAKTAELERARTDSIRPDGTVESVRKAQVRLLLAIAGLLAVTAVPLTTYIQALAARAERTALQAAQATNAADAAKAKAGTNSADQSAAEKQFRQYRANQREVWRLMGVIYPKVDGDPDPEKLEPTTPYCPPGKVCAGPQLVLSKPP